MTGHAWAKTTLVLGGGGLKGLAHVGALRALEEHGVVPSSVIGSSIGSLIGAAWCSGTSASELEGLAIAVTRRDLFRVAHRNMALKRMRSPALYQRRPLFNVIKGLLGDLTFDQLEPPLLVNSVDLNSGEQVLWGAAHSDQIPVADAVYASCALPGYLPPQRVGDRHFADGAPVANLPVEAAAARDCERVLAVDVGSTIPHREDMEKLGFATVYARATEIAIGKMRDITLKHWSRPPLILVQPDVARYSLFTFSNNQELIDEGYRAMTRLLNDPSIPPSNDAAGVFRSGP